MSSLPAPFAASLTRAVVAAACAVARLVTAWNGRRVVGRLAALDDHLLKDMGISRQDVLSVLAEPLSRDPSECLALRALEARRGRRTAATAELRALQEAEFPWPDDEAEPPRRAA